MASSLCCQRKPASASAAGAWARWPSSTRSRSTAASDDSSSPSSSGEIVSRSQPARASTCPVLRKLAPITTVSYPWRLYQFQIRVTDCTPGSSCGVAGLSAPLARCQSRMRPTKGEIRNTPASAQATAWAKENSRVRLQWMPSRSSRSAARMPSQVEAILISRRSVPMPASAYSSTSRRALATVASVSKLRRASTSVETRPGMSLRISPPIATANRSPASATRASPLPEAAPTASSMKRA